METLEVVPNPVSLIESMRSVGYSVETAVADIVDNSLSAGASSVRIQYDASDTPFVAILDNGCGMAPNELTNAMRHGSTNPGDLRSSHDLGRFGLGLKTASLSQCRQLTVVSKKSGVVSARRWDLDVVRDLGKWVVVVPDVAELVKLPLYKQFELQDAGTLVVWTDLDRLIANATDAQQEITIRMEPLFEHLALVFHRFSSRDDEHPPVSISVNGLPLAARDPFLGANPYRQTLEGQVIHHARGKVQVSPYILPPISHLSIDEIQMAGGREGLRGTQGFYIYRGRRLVIWGTWFRLVPKQEFYKLTRVRVDIPNSFDDLWSLDIKKSAAFPPDIVRARLKQLIPNFAEKSKKTIQYPGRKSRAGTPVPLWNRFEPKHNTFTYQVNLDHPLVRQLADSMGDKEQRLLQTVLEFLGASIPYESIYADMCSDQRRYSGDVDVAELVATARRLLEVTGLGIEAVLGIDPLSRFPMQHSAIKEFLTNV